MRKHYGFERAVLKELTLNLPLTSVSKLTDFFWSGRDLNDKPIAAQSETQEVVPSGGTLVS